jgi:hypothetical protein
MDHPESAGSQRADRVDFDRRVRLELHGPYPLRVLLSSKPGACVDAPGFAS